ncbi:MAG TPA: hypothetical protein VN281_22355, partial [Verrucomicrobiae bacterium]|nr:hypothetical protein [Verrucomicrobiae bacterium]
MKRPGICWLCGLVVFLLFPSPGWSQGALTPPGPPAPAMKSLAQIEPRNPVGSLPFTITNSGSYYLTGSLTGLAAQNGIIISVGNVTLDLQGFELIGAGGGSGTGIVVTGGVTNAVVINGTVRNWPGNGTDASGASGVTLKDLRATANTGDGLLAGNGGLITGCAGYGNGGAGIHAGVGCTVSACTASANGGDGILVESSCLVIGSTSITNGVAGIHAAGSQNRVEGNHAVGNATGIQVDGINNLVIRNSAQASIAQDYKLVNGNNYGQILTSPGGGFVNGNSWANFSGACATNQSVCAGICVSLGSDPANCGSCGHVCPGGQSCVSNSCAVVCPAGQVACSGTCVNEQS